MYYRSILCGMKTVQKGFEIQTPFSNVFCGLTVLEVKRRQAVPDFY
jgi:hypothetical protein